MSKEDKRLTQIDTKVGRVLFQFDTITKELSRLYHAELEAQERITGLEHLLSEMAATLHQCFDVLDDESPVLQDITKALERYQETMEC